MLIIVPQCRVPLPAAIELLTPCQWEIIAKDCTGIFILSLPCVFGFGPWSSFTPLGEGTGVLDLEDFILSNNLLPLGALVFVLFCTNGFGWGWSNFIKEADAGEGIKFPKWIKPYVAYVLPLIILGVFVTGWKDVILKLLA